MSAESTIAEGMYPKFETFRATEIWNEVLHEFRQKVPQSLPRYKKCSDENCFTGSAAVKTLESYLAQNRQKLGMKEITKEKVVKLCQILINEQIIEPSQNLPDQKFLPTDVSLYRFCAKKRSKSPESFLFDENCIKSTPRSKPSGSADVPKLWLTPNSCRSTGNNSPGANWRSFLQTPIANAFKSFDYGSVDTPRACRSGNVNPNAEAVHADDNELDGFGTLSKKTALLRHFLPMTMNLLPDENVIYDLALFRLLTLIEIPVLDGILHFKGRRDHSKGSSLENIFASLGLSSRKKSCPNDQSEISKFTDPWLLYGCNYLNELNSLNFIELNESETNHTKRIYIYRKIVETTKKLYKDEPFFAAHYDDVLKEIFELLSKKRFTLALEACQYFILLLPNEQRKRFHFLMKFLYSCSMCKDTQLSTEATNSQWSLQNLRESIVKCHSLSKSNVLQFLDFLVGNCRQVLKPPEGFRGQLFQRQFRQMYTVAEPDPGISYCQRITPAQFERQKGEASESALAELVSSVVDDLTMSLPQKIEWMDNFKKEYPELYSKRFSMLRW